MELSTLFVLILIGAAAGWLAGFIRHGRGFGLLGNIVIGVIGSFIGNWLFGLLGLYGSNNLLAAIFRAAVGAIVLLFLLGLVKGNSSRRGSRRR